ncbi:hypothetical protein SFC27_22585 [Bacillus licheniformis]|uniref:Uncharacterized protein n=2 Tax=Bacillus licheniformis TaxID=1402 RepID=A0AB37GGR4_BACLI|nr:MULTISPECIES: hypothetical protein [Bacillus]KAA0813070.1 hypothetical protein EI978_07890 [Bacillus licheniformis]KAA0821258.1 hypothetical protein EI973_18895 [Bacillus licheniformis]KAA0826482.1 hypothetical protein EI976_05425 [Bacillus licheniformis]MBU8781589.1 hypothetical protein [Bacillus licheniformis]MBU8799465.1 hypothetical protein [Bacillus licheniformis]
MYQIYACFLNGKFYGAGDLEYMHELFRDYVVYCEMYGRDDCTFRVTTKEKARELMIKESIKNNYKALERMEDE